MEPCNHCGGRVVSDQEDARDEPVLKCLACMRYAAQPRAHEEPEKGRSKRHAIPGSGTYLESEHYQEMRRQYARNQYYKKKAGA
jgi:hypothetical protein